MEGSDFLKNKYGLHNSPEVAAAAARTEARTGEKVNLSSGEGIQNYLDRFREIADRKDPAEREMGIQALKKVLLDKFVTKYQDIPESWHAFNERIIRERGQGGDWAQYSKEQKEQERRQQAEAVLADQEASLEQWVDYMASEDSSYMPDYIKYWVFRSVSELSEFDKEKGEFPKRSKGTVKMFPDINQEALQYAIEAVEIRATGEQFMFDRFEADLSDEQKNAFRKALTNENFAKMYGWANEQIHPIAKHLLPITKGTWVKYDQDSDGTENYKQLNSQIRGRGTGWCTAGENTAKTQLEAGDFYVYYTEDDEQDPLIPRIAIRMADGKIAEVRGIAYKQNLDPYMGDVLAEKLNEFPDKEQYLKKDADMKMLTTVERKIKKGEPLEKQDLVFLYEIDSSIEGFGYQKDPRVAELRALRDPKEDAPIVFECAPEEIAWSESEVTEKTKSYVGKLFPGVFQKGIEHVYTSFPEGKLSRYEVELGGKTKEQYETELKNEKKYYFSDDAKHIFKSDEWAPSKNTETANLVRLTVKDLGFSGNATTEQIYARAEELGLELCPAETGPALRLSYQGKDWMVVGLQQIAGSNGRPFVFYLDGSDARLALDTYAAKPSKEWAGDRSWVFRARKST